MKNIYYVLFALILTGCYTDDSEILTSEDVAHNSSELTTVLKSISLHNASFDNIIDNTSCFSLQFPYEVNVNSEIKTITSVSDVSDLSENDSIEIIFPVNTNFYNYEEHQAVNQTEFNLIKNSCDEGFNILSNDCLDFQYPIVVKEYNDLTESFETYQLNHDREVYLHFDNLHDNDVYEIEYPIFLQDTSSNTISINSNAEFINVFNASLQECD